MRDSLGGIGSQAQGWEAGYMATLQTPGAEAVREGYMLQRVLASYVHLHFGSHPALATSLVEACRQVRQPSSHASHAAMAQSRNMACSVAMLQRHARLPVNLCLCAVGCGALLVHTSC